jgi:hypothetical protein
MVKFWAIIDNVSSIFLEKNETDDANFKKKKAHACGPGLAGPCANLFFMGQVLSLAYLAHNA